MSHGNRWNNEEVVFEIYIIKYVQLNGIAAYTVGPERALVRKGGYFSNITQTGTVKRIWVGAIVFHNTPSASRARLDTSDTHLRPIRGASAFFTFGASTYATNCKT
ncbi:Hemin import ATP-binding protein HmuV [Trichinella spiralis]|uniref:Hemin import ATP-binding protein HmuV n=1 Tax=Trichinella spiralis TaxID=6334 RepID=A0ABR3K7R3_TRISP